MKKYYVYLAASHRNGTLTCGVTSNLVHKAWQYRSGHAAGGALVWFEEHVDMRSTLRREQQIRRAGRDWQVQLIEQTNAAWNDLYQTLLPDPSFVQRATAA